MVGSTLTSFDPRITDDRRLGKSSLTIETGR